MDDLNVVLDYVSALEEALKTTNPEQWAALAQQRERLFPVIQKQRTVIDDLKSELSACHKKLSACQLQLEALRSRGR